MQIAFTSTAPSAPAILALPIDKDAVGRGQWGGLGEAHRAIADAAAKADRIIALETQLSQDQWTPEQRRDPVATHNPMTHAELTKLAPEMNWSATLAGMGLASAAKVNVSEPSAIAAAAKRLGDVPLSTWKEWMTARFLSTAAPFLPKAFDQANFDFYSKTLRGVPEQRARWKRGMALIDDALGEAVGAIYVQKHWSPATQAKADDLVADVTLRNTTSSEWVNGRLRTYYYTGFSWPMPAASRIPAARLSRSGV